MARKSLSSQVMEELDRARGLVGSLQDSSDPIHAILLGTVLESLHRIETMCIQARQTTVNAALVDPTVDLREKSVPTIATTARPRTKRQAPARVSGEKR